MTVKYKSISAIEFYVLFNVIRLHFSGKYDIEKYGLYSTKIKKGFKNSDVKEFYKNLSSKIYNSQEAINLILANLIENPSCYITDFNLNPTSFEQLQKYNKNPFTIAQDFDNICLDTNNMKDYINSGQLAYDVIITSSNVILYSFVNKLVPIVTLSKEANSDGVINIFYKDSVFVKLVPFIKITSNVDKVKSMILESIQSTNSIQSNHEGLTYDSIYC